MMGRRAGVARSSWPITATDLVGLAGQLADGHGPGAVPAARGRGRAASPTTWPWPSPGRPSGRSWATRPRSPSTSGARSSWCSTTCAACVLPPLVRSVDVVQQAGHRGRRARHLVPARGTSRSGAPCSTSTAAATSGTSPRMYAAVHRLAVPPHRVRDLRRRHPAGPRVPVPGRPGGRRAGPRGAAGRRASIPSRLFVAGDSSGGGLVSSLVYSMDVDRPPADRRGGAVLAGAGPACSTSRRSPRTPTGTSCPGTSRPPLPARPRPGRRARCPPSTRT